MWQSRRGGGGREINFGSHSIAPCACNCWLGATSIARLKTPSLTRRNSNALTEHARRIATADFRLAERVGLAYAPALCHTVHPLRRTSLPLELTTEVCRAASTCVAHRRTA